MNIDDLFDPLPALPEFSEGYLGHKISLEPHFPEGGAVILLLDPFEDQLSVSEQAERVSIAFAEEFAHLSDGGWDITVSLPGILRKGKTPADTAYVLHEVIATCAQHNCMPILLGGSPSTAFDMVRGVQYLQEALQLSYVTVTTDIDLAGDTITEKNLLGKLLTTPGMNVNSLHLLGIQNHLSHQATNKLITELDFEYVRLAEIAADLAVVEPHLRHQDVFLLNCNAVESTASPFSTTPQVNGLDRREVCRLMQEAGFTQKLRAAGIFNFNFKDPDRLQIQLLAQMVWYLLNGYNTRRTHPQKSEFELYVIDIDDVGYEFRHDLFTLHWDVRHPENKRYYPCLRKDWEMARQGHLSDRLRKIISE